MSSRWKPVIFPLSYRRLHAPENEMKSRVDFIYSEDMFERDMDTYWKNVGKKRYRALESFIGKQKSMEPRLSEIASQRLT